MTPRLKIPLLRIAYFIYRTSVVKRNKVNHGCRKMNEQEIIEVKKQCSDVGIELLNF